jgi:hypothetical protein
VFYDRRGLPVPEAPPLVQVGPGAAEALIGENRRRGTDPDWRTASSRWKRPDDIPLDVLERAYEAA